MKWISILSALVLIPAFINAQGDTLISKLAFKFDFRFRVEQDWNSKRPDGTLRDDRTRFRYRARAGATYSDKWYNIGIRIRTGDPKKQQDPQLTLGSGSEEFGTLPIGFEKAYFEAKWSKISFWLGKNVFPFEKNNELFWSDNVFPEGIAIRKNLPIKKSLFDSLDLVAGHFVLRSSNKSLKTDAYMQGFQAYSSMLNKRLDLFSSLYLFRNVPNIPDDGGTFLLDYSIFHIGTKFQLTTTPSIILEFDHYTNLDNYNSNDSIPNHFKDQKNGFVIGLQYGALKTAGDLIFKVSYASLEQFSILDYMAQNDWARWDYSNFGSPDGRLTNYNGIEIVSSYMIDEKVSLTAKYYMVEQLIAYGIAKETGNRIRFDIDFRF